MVVFEVTKYFLIKEVAGNNSACVDAWTSIGACFEWGNEALLFKSFSLVSYFEKDK